MSHTPHALRDASLVEFAAQTDAAERTSVIIEARRLPVTPSPASMAQHTNVGPGGLLPPPATQRAAAAAPLSEYPACDMNDLEACLSSLGLAEAARRNDLNGSFVVEVTPPQLRVLAQAPSVQAIHSNRHHRRGGG